MRGVGWLSGPALPWTGVTSMNLLHVSDWLPTMVKMAGGDTSRLNVDGHDAWETLRYGLNEVCTPAPLLSEPLKFDFQICPIPRV